MIIYLENITKKYKIKCKGGNIKKKTPKLNVVGIFPPNLKKKYYVIINKHLIIDFDCHLINYQFVKLQKH